MDQHGKKRPRGGIGAVSVIALCAGALAFSSIGASSAFAADKIIVGLITKTNTNPFFAKMKEGAEAKAKEFGVDFRSYAGKFDGDNDGQVAAVENLINVGAKAIMITPSDTKAIVPSIEKARKAGILVIALNTPLDPPNAADATFATDNVLAGELIGKWAAKDARRQGERRARRLRQRVGRSAERRPPARLRLHQRLRDREFGTGKQYGHETDRTGSPATSGARAPKRAGAPRWRRCCRRIPRSTSSTPSMSRRRPAPTRR